jgi:hypothetical protein
MTMNVDVWVRASNETRTENLQGVPEDAAAWTDADVRRLLTEMLLALERAQNPGGQPPPVHLRGFSWIVSPDVQASPGSSPTPAERVLVHLEMKMGTASAGPFAIGERALSTMIERVMAIPAAAVTIH